LQAGAFFESRPGDVLEAGLLLRRADGSRGKCGRDGDHAVIVGEDGVALGHRDAAADHVVTGARPHAQAADVVVVLDIRSDDPSIICSAEAGSVASSRTRMVRLAAMRRYAQLPFVLPVVFLAGASGCGGDGTMPTARIETELRRTLAANPDYDFTVGCIERRSGGYGCSVRSGPVGVPGSEDDAYSFVGLADVTCDRSACHWKLTPGTGGGPTTGSFRVDR
jgi:hypothetical protein